jgi:hypothetical protein
MDCITFVDVFFSSFVGMKSIPLNICCLYSILWIIYELQRLFLLQGIIAQIMFVTLMVMTFYFVLLCMLNIVYALICDG